MLRLSSYFILSDRLNSGGYALFNGLTGAIEFINESLYAAFKPLVDTGDPHASYIGETDFPAEMTAEYLKRGHFTRLNHADERKRLKTVAAALHKSEASRPSFVIVPDFDCNYRCTYCFERPMQGRLTDAKTKMDTSDVDAAFAAIDHIVAETGQTPDRIVAETGQTPDRIVAETGQTTDHIVAETKQTPDYIMLYGGEPLSASNIDVVSYIVECGRARGYRFAAVTNGHDLDKYLSLLGSYLTGFAGDQTTGGIETVQITIDGPKAIHDRRRISLDGISSFDKIIANIHKALNETDLRMTIRVNLDSDNYSGFAELLSVFEREGLLNNSRTLINASVVYAKDASGAASPQYDINAIRDVLPESARGYTNVEIGAPQAFQNDAILTSLAAGKPFALRSSYCASSKGMYIFQPNGKISCCWEAINEDYGYIGSYSERGMELDSQKTDRWFNRSVTEIDACADCRYCLVCAGGCPQYAGYDDAGIYSPVCGDFRETYPWVLANAVEHFLRANGL